jgi:hypothetical protein
MAGNEFDKESLYEPLHTIRLLRLLWGKGPSKFHGYLVSFALNSVACPEFIALSYTWGSPPTHSKSIHLFNSSATKSDTRHLPSWVPDRRAHVEGKVIPVMASQASTVATGNFRPACVLESEAAYKASGDTGPQFSISRDLQVVFCRSVVVDKIDGLGGSTCSDSVRDTTDLEEEQIPPVQPISEINRSSDLIVFTGLVRDVWVDDGGLTDILRRPIVDILA